MENAILTYEVLPENARISQLKERLQQQVATIYIDAECFPEKFNDVKKAKNFAGKVEEVLATEYFQIQMSIATLKERLKADTRFNKMRIAFLQDWIEDTRSRKLGFAKDLLQRKGETDVYRIIRKYYKDCILDLTSLMIRINESIHFLVSFECFLGRYRDEINNQWKLSILETFIRRKLSERDTSKLSKDQAEEMDVLNTTMDSGCEFFKLKKYREMTVANIKKVITCELSSNRMMYAYVKEYFDATSKIALEEKHKSLVVTKREAAYRLFAICDHELSLLKHSCEQISEEYRLCRFFQGLLKKNIFKSLYV